MIPTLDAPTDLISFLRAEEILMHKIPDASLEEIAYWVFAGVTAFFNQSAWHVDDLDGPPFSDSSLISYFDNLGNASEYPRLRLLYGDFSEDGTDYLWDGESVVKRHFLENLLMRKFSRSNVEDFEPTDRLIKYLDVKARWEGKIGKEKASCLLEKKLHSKHLKVVQNPFFPTMIGLNESFLFLNEVCEIEQKEFPLGISFKQKAAKFSHALLDHENDQQLVLLTTGSSPVVTSKVHHCEKPQRRAKPTTQLIEEVADYLESQGKVATPSLIWAELGKKIGNSIIVEAVSNAYLCVGGAEEEDRITKDVIRGVLNRRREAQLKK